MFLKFYVKLPVKEFSELWMESLSHPESESNKFCAEAKKTDWHVD